MGIFDRRPLAFILSIMLFGFVSFASGEVWLRIICVCLLPLLLFLKFAIPSYGKVFIIGSVFLLISIFSSVLYFDFWFYPEHRYEENAEITAYVYKIEQTENSNEVILKTKSIDDKAFSKYKLLTYLDNESVIRISEGDTIRFKGTVKDFDKSEDFNALSYYTPLGISGKVLINGGIELINEGKPPLENYFPKIREYLRRHSVLTSNQDTGNLASALLFGERDMLDEGLRLDFKIIGITHILALSGLHLSILVLGFAKILALLGVKKKTRNVFVIIFSFLYTAFTGFAASVVRASLMLIISSLLFLVARSKDSVTSLITSVFIIILITPYSVFDVSLWLSAFATLGVVEMAEYTSNEKRKPVGFISNTLRWIKISLLASFFAVMLTFAFSAVVFGAYSVLSPISTMIFSPIIEIFMYISTAQLILGNIIPIGKISILVSNLIYYLSDMIAGIENIYVSTEFPVIYVSAIACTALFLLFLIVKVKRKRAAVISLLFIYTVFLSISITTNIAYSNRDSFEITADNDNINVIICENYEIAVISSSSYDTKQAYATVNAISDMRYTSVDKYCLTHYSFNIPDNLNIVLGRIIVKEIILPFPRNDTEEVILTRIYSVTDNFDCKISFYGENGTISLGKGELSLIYSSEYGFESIRTLYTVCYDDFKFTYVSSGMLKEDLYNNTISQIISSDAVVFSKHGMVYTNKIYLDYYTEKQQTIILNSDNLFFSQNCLIEIEKNGCEIYSHPSKKNLTLIKR